MVARTLVLGRNSSIRSSFGDKASQKACYRFLNNPKVTEQQLTIEMFKRCRNLADGRHLLVIQDSSSFNLNNHYRRLKPDSGVGPIEDNFNLGFFLHASIVVDSFTDMLLGVSDLQLWHRVYNDPKRSSKIRRLPIEDKESYKWLKASQHSKEILQEAASITFIEDRDGDIYEQFATVPNEKTHYVIRSSKDRKLKNGGKLFATMSQQSIAGYLTIPIHAERRKKRASREARVAVKLCKVSVCCPGEHPKKELPDSIDLYAVEAIEEGYSEKDKIHWRLLTTHSVECFDDAVVVIGMYKKRWNIEQLFRLLKKQGFEMEESQLESGWAIRKLCVLAINTVIRTMQLMMATEEEKEQSATHVFDKNEQACLDQINKQYQGKTQKQTNLYKPHTLLWAKWIIARLGGWKGYKSQRPPGPITLKRGLDKFVNIYSGWQLALALYKDVGTQ